MARSTAQSGEAPCPNCGRPVPLEIWLIVDVAERPDLAQRIRDGSIRTIPCSHCGNEGGVDAPLLVHDPERRRVLFVPARQTTEEEDGQLAAQLLGQLAETFVHPRPDYLNQAITVPRALLPAVLDANDPQVVLEEAAQEAAAQELPLLNTLQTFIQADTWTDSRGVVEAHPELLDNEADALLGQIISAAQDQGDESALRIFEEHRTLLHRCREIGIEAAFDEKAGAPLPDDAPPEARAALEAMAALPPDLRDALAELMGRVSSPEEFEAALAEEPELRAALEEALAGPSGGPNVPPAFQGDLRRAAESEARYRRSGDRAALDVAAEVWQSIWDHPAFATAPTSFRLAALNDGAGVYLRRYWASGQLSDLSVALQCWEGAVAGTPEGSPDLPGYLNNLGTGLRARYARTGDLADLARAIESYEGAVAGTPEGSPERAAILNNLGTGLRARYARTGDLADLARAIESYEGAVAGTPEGSPDLPSRLNNLGTGLRARYARTGDLADLARAIESYEGAVAGTPEGSPERAAILNNLGTGLSARYARTGDLADLARAIESYETTCRLGWDVATEESLRAARNWGSWATQREEWSEAARAYDYGLGASERLFRGQLLRTSKESWLREARGLHARAGYAQARAGDLRRAVEILEGGRARLLAQVLERDRADLSQLESLAPAAYQGFVVAADYVQVLEAQEMGGEAVLPPGQTLTDALRQARADLDAAVEAIRAVPDYENFLQPLAFAQIQAAVPAPPLVGEGPAEAVLVYLAVTPAGALALIVRSEGRGVEAPVIPLWLDDLTEEALRERVQGPDDDPKLGGYLGAYARWRTDSQDPSTRDAWFAALDEMTGWLWDVLMGQLVEALADLGLAQAVLVPQGWLGLLPLHAAWTVPDVPGISEVPGTSGRRYALDEICFTYTPNARALLAARRTAARVAPDHLLAVDEPWPVSGNPLPNSAREVTAACEHFPDDQRSVLGGEAATEETVRERLRDYSVLHFSCHGLAGFARPLEGGLVMAHDERLTLGDILALRLENARLAVLSACETGIPGTQLPDEVVSLPAGLAQAGVAGIVASLWSVGDLSTMMLMARFYELWKGEGLEPPQALRQAQFWVRDTTNGQKADYFKGFLPEFNSGKMPLPVADTLYKASILARPEENDFEDPFFWAAFGYTGV